MFNVPVIESKPKFYARDDLTVRSLRKVHIPKRFGYRFVADDGQCAIGGQCEAYILDEYDTFEGVLSYFNSRLVRAILTKHTWMPQTHYTLIELLPKLDFSRVWTDTELYEHFGLTEEEPDATEHFGLSQEEVDYIGS